MNRSKLLFAEAQKVIPGGVNSPVRAFKSVGGEPIFFERGSGCKLYDVDGKEYIDYVLSWGPLILGHSPKEVSKAIADAAEKGTSFGAPTELEVVFAKMITQMIPSIQKVRLVSSGTEAVMSAIRLARAYTGRDKIVKFEGNYHGHCDSMLVKAGSGATTLGVPDSPGVPASLAKDTVSAIYNDIENVREIFKQLGDSIACVIVEPVAGNMGVVPPEPGFLEGLREITSKYKALLIFDEVITGFRVSSGGAQKLYGIEPDLTCLGKIIGGGLPIGAFGGKSEIMEMIAPTGPVYQAGTLSGNPIAVSAGIATLKVLQNPQVYELLEKRSKILTEEMEKIAKKHKISTYHTRVGSMFCTFFTDQSVRNYQEAKRSDIRLYSRFFHRCLEGGVYFAPSQFESAFLSLAHTEEDLSKTLNVIDQAMKGL